MSFQMLGQEPLRSEIRMPGKERGGNCRRVERELACKTNLSIQNFIYANLQTKSHMTSDKQISYCLQVQVSEPRCEVKFTGSVELAYAEDSPIKLCNAMKQSNIAFREHAGYVHATVLQRFQDVEGVARPRQCRCPDSELMQQNRSGSNPTLLSTPQIASGHVIGPRREPSTV